MRRTSPEKIETFITHYRKTRDLYEAIYVAKISYTTAHRLCQISKAILSNDFEMLFKGFYSGYYSQYLIDSTAEVLDCRVDINDFPEEKCTVITISHYPFTGRSKCLQYPRYTHG